MKPNNKLLDNILTTLGKSNDSEIVTAALAGFKLAFIPMATMSDKKSTPEQKKYAIKRDILTESTALLGYIGITKAIKNTVTAPICSKYYKNKANKFVKSDIIKKDSIDYKVLSNVNKNTIKKYAMSELAPKKNELTKKELVDMAVLNNVIKKFPDSLQNPKNLYFNTKKTISHLCVCTLALSIIPFATNKILKIIDKKNKSKINDFNNSSFSNYNNKPIKKIPSMNSYIENIKTKGAYNVFSY